MIGHLPILLPVLGVLGVAAPTPAEPPAAPAAGRVPGGFHTIAAVAGGAVGHKVLTPKSGGWMFAIEKAVNLLADRPTDVWIVPRPFPEDAFELARHGVKVQTARTDANGELRNVEIDRPLVIGDTIVVDYDGDGNFVPQLDAKFDTWEWAKQIVRADDPAPVSGRGLRGRPVRQ